MKKANQKNGEKEREQKENTEALPMMRQTPIAAFGLMPLLLLALCLAAFCLLKVSAAAQFEATKPQAAKLKKPPFLVIHQAIAYITTRDTGDRMRAESPLPLEDLLPPDEWMSLIMLDPTRRFQTILGFGGAFTDAAAETFAKLPPAKQAEVLTAYFSPDKGIGYTPGRTNINSCDFSSDTYSCDDMPGDTGLTHFSIAHTSSTASLSSRLPLPRQKLLSGCLPRRGVRPHG